MLNNAKNKIVAAVVITVLLVSSLIVAINVSALQPKYGNISFVLKYTDVQSGKSDFLNGISVSLTNYEGTVISSTTSTPYVQFTDIPYGNYIVNAHSKKIGTYVYQGVKTEITVNASGSSITSLTLNRTALNNTLNLKIYKNALPLYPATVYLYTSYGLLFYTGQTTTTGNLSVSVPFETLKVKITYIEGSTIEHYYTSISISSTTVNRAINVGNYSHIYGTVSDLAGNPVSTTIRLSFINSSTGAIWQTFLFNNGLFDLYVPATPIYRVVVTADGYGIVSFNSVAGFYPIKLPYSNNTITQSYKFNTNFTVIHYTYTIHLNNASILNALSYNNIGVLYYQLKYLGYSAAQLARFFNDSIEEYTNNMVLVDGQVYELKSHSVQPFTINYAGFNVTVNAIYINNDLNISTILKTNGYIPLNIYVEPTKKLGSKINYFYTITLPPQLERANSVTQAQVHGYINTLSISNVTTATFINLQIKERKSPEMVLNAIAFSLYWKGIEKARNYVVNQSISNYTVIVPAHVPVYYNASGIAYDVVREVTAWQTTVFTWVFDNGYTSHGMGDVNVSATLSPGVHSVKITATVVGNNTNTTTIYIYADGAYPSSKSQFSISKTVLISWNVKYLSNTVIYSMKNSTHSVNLQIINGTYHAVLPQITINQSQKFKLSASSINDTINGHIPSNMPVVVLWDVNNTEFTGATINTTINYPTRHGVDWINVTYTDTVNNSVTISIPVKVRDTLKPHPVFTMFNSTLKPVHSIPEGSIVILNGSKSWDPQGGTVVSYHWTVHASNGSALHPNSTYTVVNGSLNSSVVTLKFTKYGLYYIILNVSDMAGNYNINNQTLQVSPVRPDLAINNISWSGKTFTEGVTGYLYINVSNDGNAPATVYYIALYVNGKLYSNATFTNLTNGSYVVKKIAWTPASPGTFTIKVKVYTPTEPSIYLGDNVMSKNITVKQSAWKLPAMVIGVILIIVIIGYVAFRFSKSKTTKKQFKKKKTSREEKPKLKQKRTEKNKRTLFKKS